MDCVSPILNAATCLWDRSSKYEVYVCDLEQNLESLRGAMIRLKAISEDVKTRVLVEEQQQMIRRTNQVSAWLQSVEDMEKEVNEIQERGVEEIQNKCVGGCCPKNCRSTYKLGKIVINKFNAVNQLLEQRERFDVIAARLPRAPVEEKPVGKTVGSDSMLEMVWRWIRDENVGIIGLYGTGGVGKTTLLKKINNEFAKISHGFDVVIWADVSRDGNVEKVQDEILKKLGFSNIHAIDQDEKATKIFGVLNSKTFVLQLDDLWKPLDLLTLGVPVPDNHNKSTVVFTTRFEDVCGHMDAKKKIKVEFLSQKDAWELFQMKVGEQTLNLHPEIPKLAMVAAEECGGLPVALITIGRAMASKKTLREWKHALEILKKAPSKIPGMGHSVFPRLKLSYDSLSSDAIRSCFIYYSLRAGHISTEWLVDLWIAEGFLDEFDNNIREARKEGHAIIENLKLACLLENSDTLNFVRMHDVIRDMALWIGRECGSKMDKFVVQEDDALIKGCEISKWKEAERISLWDNAIERELNQTPACLNLLTLVVRSRDLKTFPSGFFQFMPILRVLDLSFNSNLTELPMEICVLVSLKFLDLSRTKIRQLPRELKKLVNLKFLKLRQMPLEIIPEQVISSLSMLRVFNMSNSWSTYGTTGSGNVLAGGNEGLLAELECLDYLEDLRITIESIPAFQLLQSSHKLRSQTSYLTLKFCHELTSLPLSTLKDMKCLEWLSIDSCVDLKNITTDYVGAPVPAHNIIQNSKILWDKYFHNLFHVFIQECHNILDLTWLICIPSLQRLMIADCKSLEQVIICDYDHGSDIAELEESSSIFSRLQGLFLYDLPELKSIYRHTLPFHSLTDFRVKSCPKLKKLPLDSNSAKNSLKKISAEKEWWDELEWDDDSTRLHFLPYLVPTVSYLSCGDPTRRMGMYLQGRRCDNIDYDQQHQIHF